MDRYRRCAELEGPDAIVAHVAGAKFFHGHSVNVLHDDESGVLVTCEYILALVLVGKDPSAVVLRRQVRVAGQVVVVQVLVHRGFGLQLAELIIVRILIARQSNERCWAKRLDDDEVGFRQVARVSVLHLEGGRGLFHAAQENLLALGRLTVKALLDQETGFSGGVGCLDEFAVGERGIEVTRRPALIFESDAAGVAQRIWRQHQLLARVEPFESRRVKDSCGGSR